MWTLYGYRYDGLKILSVPNPPSGDFVLHFAKHSSGICKDVRHERRNFCNLYFFERFDAWELRVLIKTVSNTTSESHSSDCCLCQDVTAGEEWYKFCVARGDREYSRQRRQGLLNDRDPLAGSWQNGQFLGS